MSQELIGNCGTVVGSGEYFHKINQNTIFAPFMTSSGGYQYSAAAGQLCDRCVVVIDESYADMQNAKSILPRIPDNQKENLITLIENLEKAAGFLFPAFTNANGCRDLLSRNGPDGETGILSLWVAYIGSDGYLQSKCSPIFRTILSDPLSNISQRIRQDLSAVAEQITADIDRGLQMHHYVRDETATPFVERSASWAAADAETPRSIPLRFKLCAGTGTFPAAMCWPYRKP